MILLKLLAIAEIFIGTVNSENTTEEDNLFTTIDGRDAEEGEFTYDNLYTTINVRDAEEGEFTEDDNLTTTINGRDAEEGEFTEDHNFRRILNARSATEGEIPYQVQILRSGRFICSGAIIDKYHILTVAHWFTSKNIKRNITVVGGVLYKYDYDTPHSFVRECSEIYVHEGYRSGDGVYYNDIAILRKIKSFDIDHCVSNAGVDLTLEVIAEAEILMLYGGLRHFTTFVRSISLNRSKTREQRCIVAGWGSVSRRKRMGPPLLVHKNYPLQVANIRLLTGKSCKDLKTYVPYGTICTGAGEGNAYMCDGEGGDPLVCDGKLMGVAAYHYGCRKDRPRSFYAEVYYHTAWIDNIIRISNKEINKFS